MVCADGLEVHAGGRHHLAGVVHRELALALRGPQRTPGDQQPRGSETATMQWRKWRGPAGAEAEGHIVDVVARK